jgi:hypothetical protein
MDVDNKFRLNFIAVKLKENKNRQLNLNSDKKRRLNLIADQKKRKQKRQHNLNSEKGILFELAFCPFLMTPLVQLHMYDAD